MHSVSYQVAAKLYTTKVRTVALETVSNVVSSVVSRPLLTFNNELVYFIYHTLFGMEKLSQKFEVS